MPGVSEDCKKPCLLVDLVYVLEGVTWFSFWLAKNVKRHFSTVKWSLRSKPINTGDLPLPKKGDSGVGD